MKKKGYLITWFLLLLSISEMYSQPSGQAKEVFDLINMARVTPTAFLTKYKGDIEKCSPQFAKILKKASPIQKVIWDPGLEVMQKEQVTKGNLNPQYPGKMTGFNLSSGGSGSNSNGQKSIDIICQFYTLINDASQSHFAIFLNKTTYSFGWGASTTINNRKAFLI